MASSISSTARFVFRSSSFRNVGSRFASKPKVSTSSPFHAPANRTFSQAVFRSPVELSFAVESMIPYHTVTASALMTSMLSISQRSYGWLPEGRQKTR